MISDLQLKEAKERTAEENYLLGENYRYKASVATERGLSAAAKRGRLMALKCYNQAEQQGHYGARRRYFALKYSAA